MNLDSTFTLISRDVLLGVSDVYFQHPVKAVLHANGRDWWLYMLIRNSDQYQLILLDQNGFHFMGLLTKSDNQPAENGDLLSKWNLVPIHP